MHFWLRCRKLYRYHVHNLSIAVAMSFISLHMFIFFRYFIHARAFGTGSSSHTFILTGLTISLRSCWSDCAHYKALMYRTSRDPRSIKPCSWPKKSCTSCNWLSYIPELLTCVVFPHILSIFAFKIWRLIPDSTIFRVPKKPSQY